MLEREQIQKAIDLLQDQRALLGDRVVETTITTLQEKLSLLDGQTHDETAQRTAQRKQVTILFANVTGFSGVAEAIPDTNMLDIMNGLWRRLDSAITRQDGMIDKHMGEAVMGLFGVPIAHEDDPERAIRAALTMRAALSDFIMEVASREQAEWPSSEPDNTPIHHLQDLRLSIGINTGPVLLGRVGSSEEYTVIGDAVNVASRLEKAASPGSILISHDTYMLVQDIFNVEALGPVEIRGRSEPIDVYMVLGVKPRLFYASGRGVEGVETRMIGRVAELEQLKTTLKTAIKDRVGQIVTIVGEAGVGKSRLVHEFNNWIKAQPYEIPVFKGRTYQQISQLPYALFRDLLATYFEIQDNDPAALAEEKLVQGMGQFMGGDNEEVRRWAHAIGQLIGLDLSEGFQVASETGDVPQLQARAYEYITHLFEVITTIYPAVLVFLEDLHWADEGSWDLIWHLAQSCRQFPLIIVIVTRPNEAYVEDGRFALDQIGQRMHLSTLSAEESHQLVLEILQKLPEIPDDLSRLIVERAGGNPFYVEELIKILIEDGVIIAGEEQWQLRRNQLTDLRVPPHITGVLQARLDRLSMMERVTLQRAAVVGRVFWDSAVIHMNETAVEPLTPAETVSALQALEKREMIFLRQTSGFAGSQAYVFKHAILHQVTYESVLLRARPVYHKQAADWLARQSGDRITEYAGSIAEHYELAEEKTKAAELYEMAATRARDAFNLPVGIDYFCKALSLLSEKAHHAAWHLRLQEELGHLLRRRARFVEAAQTYMTMRFTAEEDGDLSAQARAWNGLAVIHREQAQYAPMLNSATKAEEVAWLVSAEATWVEALLLKSEAHLLLGDLELAQAAIQRALDTSEQLDSARHITTCLFWLGEIYIRLGKYERVERILERLERHQALREVLDDQLAVALGKYAVGRLCNRLGRYDQAASNLLGALERYRSEEARQDIAKTLNALGETAHLRGNFQAAIPLYRKALTVANGIGDRQNGLVYRLNLAAALVKLDSFAVAERTLRQVKNVAENVAFMADWKELPRTNIYLARLALAQGSQDEALALAAQATASATRLGEMNLAGLVWRHAGRILAALPPALLPVTWEERTYDPAACFQESLRCFEKATNGGEAAQRELAFTYWAWSAYAHSQNDEEEAARLKTQAIELAGPINVTLPDEDPSSE